jgi:hypothetical protein
MNTLKNFLLGIFYILIFCGCSESYIAGRLSAAESCIEENPDSAMQIIEGIDPKSIKNDDNMAQAQESVGRA